MQLPAKIPNIKFGKTQFRHQWRPKKYLFHQLAMKLTCLLHQGQLNKILNVAHQQLLACKASSIVKNSNEQIYLQKVISCMILRNQFRDSQVLSSMMHNHEYSDPTHLNGYAKMHLDISHCMPYP